MLYTHTKSYPISLNCIISIDINRIIFIKLNINIIPLGTTPWHFLVLYYEQYQHGGHAKLFS